MGKVFEEGTVYHGFRLIEKRFVREVNAECLHFEHVKSGASLLKVCSDDANKTFCIGFKTFPSSDNGAPHILEHAVLNGSKHFPVKSPFDVLLKGSLNTFLNAFTSKDYTMYPVASMNAKDYFNLMHVYLDAVFNPLIYNDPRIFMQEGWHYSLGSHEEKLAYTGVVYNEMKGAFSNPQHELWYQTFRHLFPDNAYGFESGGRPAAIPGLSQEEFLAFHRIHYHPENSYIFLYGDADPETELSFLDSHYLGQYARTGRVLTIEDQPRFPELKVVTERFAMAEGSDTADQTYLTLNYVAGHNTDPALTMALDVLCEVLVNQESAPVRHALLEAGIGQDVMASSSNFKQHAVQIAAFNANPGDTQRFHDIVMHELRKAADEGLNKEEIEGVINRIEFRLREGDDAQKGLTCLNMALPRWFFAGDPITGLAYERPLAEIKKALTTPYLEDIIRKYFLDNPHALLLTLEPSLTLEKEQEEAAEARLRDYRSSLDEAQTQAIIASTRQLIQYQQQEDSPEALATIPMLGIGDIDRQAVFHETVQMDLSGIPVLALEEFTNDVVYVSLLFDAGRLTRDLLPYAALLTALAGSMNTEHYTYGDLNKALNIHTGSFYTSLRSYLAGSDDNRLLPRFIVTSKAMNHKTEKLFELAEEVIGHSLFNDPDRLKTLIARHQSQLDAQVKGNGYHVASRRLISYISNQGMFGELTGGLTYYRFVTEMMKGFDTHVREIIAALEQTASLLFTRDNLVVAVTCAKKDLDTLNGGMALLARALPEGGGVRQEWNLIPEKRNEGLMAASNVQYVIQGYNFRKLGYPWSGKMRVLNQVLSTDWLQNRIRVIGGAYGGFCHISHGGNFTFNSYRDPNLETTLENFAKTPGYLSSFDADLPLMTRYIIGTIAEMDAPLTPSQKGEQAFHHFLTGRTAAELQRDRDETLSTTPQDIRDFAPLVQEVLDQQAICVYGGTERLTAAREIFGALLKVD